MSVLEKLREKNPGLPLFGVEDEAFAPYGRVLGSADAALSAALAETELPAEGNLYHASEASLEALPLMARLRRLAFGEMEIQAGFCNGRGFTLNALEYHKSSEVNFTTRGLVLLLALPEQLHDGALSSADVVGFYLPPMVPVEIYPRVLHFAPCRVEESGFNCLVVLPLGTNTPLSHVDTSAPGEEKLLWMKNKWMTCHPDSPQAGKGAWPGISGENLQLKL